jgi:hypothetical protein
VHKQVKVNVQATRVVPQEALRVRLRTLLQIDPLFIPPRM